MSRLRRSVMSFTKEEAQKGRISLNASGVPIALPTTVVERAAYMASFGDYKSTRYSLGIESDLMPKPEDFVDVPFRLLSAGIVAGGSWRATDFSDESVLRASVKKLDGKPVYKDHSTWTIDNCVGIVKAPKFTSAFTASDNTKIPAGIDGIVSIDGKSHPNIARAVLLGSIFSNSVTVEFDWVPSHKFDSDEDFERNVGKVIDGRMVCRKVTFIHDYFESSLVWLGADPHAKKIMENGDLLNVDHSAVYPTDENDITEYKKVHSYKVNYAFTKEVISLAKPTNTKENNNIMELNILIAALKKKLKLADDAELTMEMVEAIELKAETEPNNEIQEAAAGFISEVTGEEVKTENLSKDIIEKYKGMALVKKEDKDALETFKTEKTKLEKESNDAKSEVSKLTTENIQLKADKATLESEVTKLSDNAKIGEATLKNKRSECLRLYKLSVDNKTVPAVESLIEKASSEELDGLLQQYGKGMTEKFTFKCKDCGSAHAEVQSSFVAGKNGGDPDPSKNASVESVSVETIHTNFLKAQKTEKK